MKLICAVYIVTLDSSPVVTWYNPPSHVFLGWAGCIINHSNNTVDIKLTYYVTKYKTKVPTKIPEINAKIKLKVGKKKARKTKIHRNHRKHWAYDETNSKQPINLDRVTSCGSENILPCIYIVICFIWNILIAWLRRRRLYFSLFSVICGCIAVPAHDHLIRVEAMHVRPNYALKWGRKGGQIVARDGHKQFTFPHPVHH